jgi:HEPN domain-containing protein
MKEKHHHTFNPQIIAENEAIAREAYERGDYVFCFLLTHSLVESLLRAFLEKTGEERFSDLIKAYEHYLKKEGQTKPTFVDELNQFNKRRNRTIHELWKHGYSNINKKLAAACRAAFIMLGLFIEWLETFNPEIAESGFTY